MMRDAEPHDDTRRGRRPLRIGFIASGLLAAVVLATACAGGSGGPGVARAGSSNSPTASASSDTRTDAVAYSQCMRDQGISDFPDPDADGHVDDQQVEEESDVVAEAREACQGLLPEGDSDDAGSTGERGALDDVLLAYAQCMRDHGISEFPDPEFSDGQFVIPKNGNYDPLDPAVQEADEACLQSLEDADTSSTEAPGD